MPANLKIEAKQRLRLTFSLNTNAGQVKRRIESVKGIRYVEIVREATIPSRPATSAPPVLGPSAPSPKTPSILGTPSISSYWAQDFVAKSKMPQGLKLTNIAILDSGVDIEHLALKNSVYCTDKESKVDPSGHGTFVAGIIVGRSSPAGATSPNSDTIDGMLPDSKAWMCTVIDPVGVNWGGGNLTYFVDPGWYSWGLNKIAYDRENNITTGQGNIQVVNLSLGSEAWSYTEALDIQRVINSGCAIVAASGNRSYYSDYAMYPAILPGVIAVGAYKYQNKSELWDWTNSRGVDESSFITAPGEGIFSCVPTKPNGMGIEFSGWSSGTSFAAPFVTAMAAAWLSIPNNQPKKLMAGIGFGGSETEWPTLLWK
jgi:subtilisin family serine protease